MPVGYDADPARRWPVTYVTAGTMNTYTTFSNFLNGEKLTREHPAIIVSPERQQRLLERLVQRRRVRPADVRDVRDRPADPADRRPLPDARRPLPPRDLRDLDGRLRRRDAGCAPPGPVRGRGQPLGGRRQQPPAQRRRPVGQLDVRRRPRRRDLWPAVGAGGPLARPQPDRPRGEPARPRPPGPAPPTASPRRARREPAVGRHGLVRGRAGRVPGQHQLPPARSRRSGSPTRGGTTAPAATPSPTSSARSWTPWPVRARARQAAGTAREIRLPRDRAGLRRRRAGA